jgi:hypothetical protein
MWYSENIGTFNRARSFKYESVIYPATAFKTPEILMAATIYPMRVETVDNRYYTQGAESREFADNAWVVSYEAIPKDTEELRKFLIKDYLGRMDSTLSATDKYVVRQPEMNRYFSEYDLNNYMLTWREAIYGLYQLKITAFVQAESFEDLITVDKIVMEVPEQPVPYEIEE